MLMLEASSDFQRLARSGKKWATPAFIMQALKAENGGEFRLGLTASRKVGNAVVRNRAKRRLREMVREFLVHKSLHGFEIVLIARQAAVNYNFSRMKEDFSASLVKLGALS